jgi:putative membrane protein
MGLMWLWWVVGLALLVSVILAVSRSAGSARPPADNETPEAILKRRYARGELDEQEYERRLSNLRK